mmetsp:Transcript_22860/g.28171  ORF Transcript_22860/g.28171 Transcript_22860/m.28171 type:complete len:99 (+) Transcript_22860:108-404(+)
MMAPFLTSRITHKHAHAQLGADVSLHSATKHLLGHLDALLGLLTTSPYADIGRWIQRGIHKHYTMLGTIASPLDCYLMLRGLPTLELRVERQSGNPAL